MKGEKGFSFLTAAVLAFALSFGVTGCLISGLELEVTGMGTMALICAGASVVCALGCLWKHGPGLLLGGFALGLGYLWRQGALWEQLASLAWHISGFYDRAYGWGTLALTEDAWRLLPVDQPLAVWAVWTALLVSLTVCQGHGTWLASAWTVLPMALCFVVTDTVPEEGYLFLLMAGMVLLLLTAWVRRENVAQGNRLAALAAVPVLLALAGLFLAVPREGYDLYPRELQDRALTWVETLWESTVEHSSGTGIQTRPEERVDLAGLGPREENTIPVMEVRAGQGGSLYLREQDYDGYDGRGWQAGADRREPFSGSGNPAGDVTIRTRQRQKSMFLPYYPAGETELVGGTAGNPGRLEYTLSRSVLPENWRETAYNSGISGETGGMGRYLELPPYTRQEAEALLAELLPQGASNTEKADAIATLVRNCAVYDVNAPYMASGEEDFALWFLEDAGRGYCVHFATAATVLLRAAEVPARYVTGYAVRVPAGETVTVTGEHAHAWAEYYEPALDAWIVLEATPGEFPGAQVATEPSWQETYETTLPEPETTETVALPEETAAEPASGPTAGTEPPERPGTTETPGAEFSGLGTAGKGLLLLLGAGLILMLQRSLRVRLTWMACRTGSPNAQALARWREAERLAKLLRQEPPDALADLARKAKFSQHTLTQEELAKFDAYQRAGLRSLRKKPWYLRLVYQYIFAVY